MEGLELGYLGVAVVRRGSRRIAAGTLALEEPLVNVDNWLSLSAACAAKRILMILPGVEEAYVTLRALTRPGDERVEAIEARVEYRGEAAEERVEEAFWSCPTMGLLRPWIRRVEVSRRAS